jgi:hypothetical protein
VQTADFIGAKMISGGVPEAVTLCQSRTPPRSGGSPEEAIFYPEFPF